MGMANEKYRNIKGLLFKKTRRGVATIVIMEEPKIRK